MKEKMLTILVPIKQSDVTANYTDLSDLQDNITPSANNVNEIYSVGGNQYYRPWYNPDTKLYEFKHVVDREFPEIGNPLEIFDFTYDATRMGQAPTISAQNVKWYAYNDAEGNEVTLDGMWSQSCHVTFNNENFYLQLIPTARKSNEDARYNYDIDFVSERVVLEHVYLYDVVQPFVSERPVSESSEFSFYGDISELVNRINASLVRSGLAKLQLKEGVVDGSFLTYSEFNQSGIGSYTGDKNIKYSSSETYFEHFGGDYNLYLLNCVYLLENNVPVISGYKCVIGKDKYGEVTTSEEKLITFENNTIHEALQQVHDTFELQYYVTKGSNGNTIITIGDCEHDFADWDEDNDDYVRDSDGLPTTAHPFDYGVDDALLSKEKANTTDKIVNRITGVGSEENIPWYYPNPNADGWIQPTCKRDGEEIAEIDISYPLTEDDTYEKYLKNRIGDVFNYGKRVVNISKSFYLIEQDGYNSYIDDNTAVLYYSFSLQQDSVIKTGGIRCSYDETNTNINVTVYKNQTPLVGSFGYLISGGTGTLLAGSYVVMYTIEFTQHGPSVITDVEYYYYPTQHATCDCVETWGWRQLLNILLSIFTFGAIRTLIQTFSNFDATIPGFLSKKPNLRFKRSRDATKLGWYDGDRRIDIHPYSSEDFTIGNPNTDYYAFIGGNGVGTIGVNDVCKVRFDGNISTQNLQIMGIDAGNALSVQDFFSNINSGISAKRNSISSVEDINYNLEEFVREYITFDLSGYVDDGWYKNNKKVNLEDFGISVDSTNIYVSDTIEFKRIKYVTPQPNLMPELYIKTDGERRFYNAYNYPMQGTNPDSAAGEISSEGTIVNPIYKKDDDSPQYVFENPYLPNIPHEHIEVFEDVKPTIKGQTNYIKVTSKPDDWDTQYTRYFVKDSSGNYSHNTSSTWDNTETYFSLSRIDVVEEFAYDLYDNDEVWEDNSNGNVSGEYKHPYLFAKLRPLGFNIFDLALQDDMVLSMTTGHCGACNFKIGVDEETGKNPVQIWEYDVYSGTTYATKGEKVYSAGDLRRYVDTSNLYYDKDGTSDGYVLVDSEMSVVNGFLVAEIDREHSRHTMFDRTAYSAEMVINGEVGSLKQEPKTHFEGDVKIGKFCTSQQDTSENYVWVALYKDIDTYGTIMPSAKPDYGDDNYSVYIEPKGAKYFDRKNNETIYFSDNDADKFVLTNIRLPQVYLRRAEKDLSRKIVAFMYDNNYQKFNFSINLSRIFVAQHPDVESKLNENSVLYVKFNNKIYRQYVKSYSYKMSHNDVLPEITVELNEELNVSRTYIEQQAAIQNNIMVTTKNRLRREIARTSEKVIKRTIGKNEDVLFSGNIVSRSAFSSLNELKISSRYNESEIFVNKIGHDKVSEFNTDVASRINQIKYTIEERVIPITQNQIDVSDRCIGHYTKKHWVDNLQELNPPEYNFWYKDDGTQQDITNLCVSTYGMDDLVWESDTTN